MKTLTYSNRALLLSGACAGLAVVAMGFAGNAQARDNLTFSVSVGGPGVVVGASNAYPVYTQPRPVYVQPRPVYVQPAPVYVQPAPVYVQPQVYYPPRAVYYAAPAAYTAPQPIYYARPQGWAHGHYKKHYRQEIFTPAGHGPGYYNPGYAPVYYQR